jgi:transcriptional regulator with XRE-family HTH domain
VNREEYLAKRRQDPEYREVEKRLKPILDLADDVFHLRMERGWTQAELAKRVGTRQANISRLENGLANPTFGFLQKLSEVFETDLVVRLRPQPVEVRVQPAEVLITDWTGKRETRPRHTPLYSGSRETFKPLQKNVYEQIRSQFAVQADPDPTLKWTQDTPTQPPCVA